MADVEYISRGDKQRGFQGSQYISRDIHMIIIYRRNHPGRAFSFCVRGRTKGVDQCYPGEITVEFGRFRLSEMQRAL
jgi:hypothetical protein